MELHKLVGVGKVVMLGPNIPEWEVLLKFQALVDDSLIVLSSKAVIIVGDVTSSVAVGDRVAVGTCSGLVAISLLFEWSVVVSSGSVNSYIVFQVSSFFIPALAVA